MSVSSGDCQSRVDHSHSSTEESSSTNTASTLVSTSTSITSQPVIAISTITLQSEPLPFFNTNVSVPCHIHQLHNPSKPLDSTYQLAYCLALLQASGQEDSLAPDELAWIDNTLKNPNEKSRLDGIVANIVAIVDKKKMKDEFAVAEIDQLAPLLDAKNSRLLLSTLVDTINDSEMLHLHSIKGLAKVVQSAAPGSIDADDLVVILRCLHKNFNLFTWTR
ncbi:hypothetical protein FBU30_008972 [Linnemannia zychae]|nr:hypothetical protein FBU30_008972 [Linnemannia zychae]